MICPSNLSKLQQYFSWIRIKVILLNSGILQRHFPQLGQGIIPHSKHSLLVRGIGVLQKKHLCSSEEEILPFLYLQQLL